MLVMILVMIIESMIDLLVQKEFNRYTEVSGLCCNIGTSSDN